MITTEQLQAMSDIEINHVLAKHFTGAGSAAGVGIDYCNNHNDIMPLAFERLIAIEPEAQAFTDRVSGNWIATDYNINHQYIDKSPLRAIACCLILVLQERTK